MKLPLHLGQQAFMGDGNEIAVDVLVSARTVSTKGRDVRGACQQITITFPARTCPHPKSLSAWTLARESELCNALALWSRRSKGTLLLLFRSRSRLQAEILVLVYCISRYAGIFVRRANNPQDLGPGVGLWPNVPLRSSLELVRLSIGGIPDWRDAKTLIRRLLIDASPQFLNGSRFLRRPRHDAPCTQALGTPAAQTGVSQGLERYPGPHGEWIWQIRSGRGLTRSTRTTPMALHVR